MRESKVHEKVAILHVGKDELVHLIPALEESSHDGTTGVLFPELQDIRLVRRHGVEFGTLQGEESVKERLMNVLAKRRARGLGPFSIFLGLKEEQTEEILTSAGQ
ncbi:hypothetical protein PsYK624_061880 [Phanerochaete sordida]|uniref:Uncharacterized protein n=1 Tax=Phanerochaete sordida TaxID=48140 RepID=A0A9P3G8V9_9APHY|nr:hypothetical protein PsYK624_061880 [Phanerochaete sordida]